MSERHRLPQVQAGLGRPTTMDPALAVDHGVAYVHLTAFAIDIDRVFIATDGGQALPLAWEVTACLGYLLETVDSRQEAGRRLLEDCSAHILAFPAGAAPLGAQLAFAIYAGAHHHALDAALLGAFRAWKRPPRQLLAAAAEFLREPGPPLQRSALHCMGAKLTPPLSPPTLSALSSMAQGLFALPYRADTGIR